VEGDISDILEEHSAKGFDDSQVEVGDIRPASPGTEKGNGKGDISDISRRRL
jgi:hypothetical protein